MRDLFRFLFRARNTLLFLVLLAFSMVLLHGGNQYHRARAISSSSALVGTIYSWRTAVTDYANLKEVNERLAAENADLRSRHVSAYTLVEDIFVRINDTIYRQQYSYTPAKVVNSTWHKQRNFLTLDKGVTAGLHADMGVIGTDGIVGVVREVSPHFASVISVLSPDIKTSVQLRRTGHIGLLYWNTNDPRTASFTDLAKHVRVVVGDTVETRGGDGLFPKGIPVGVVTEVRPDEPGGYLGITLRLTEDLTRSGYVHVVRDLQRVERDTIQNAHRTP
jgi:rod shape-determining protein MreC